MAFAPILTSGEIRVDMFTAMQPEVSFPVNGGTTNRSVVPLVNDSGVFGFAPKAMVTAADQFVLGPRQRICPFEIGKTCRLFVAFVYPSKRRERR